VTFSPAPSATALCASWNNISHPDLQDSGVVVHGTEATSGDDIVTVTDADCKGGFHFGNIDLGQAGYFSGIASFGGNVAGCKDGTTTACSTILWDGRTLTITLGAASSSQPIQPLPSVAVYTPAGALGLSSSISSVLEEQF
jgi:hypothetical protein